jgi:hypothetical protein
MAQHRDLQVRRALGHDAVMADVALHEFGEPAEIVLEAVLEALAVTQEGEVGEDHRLQDGYGLVADHPGAGGTAQMRALTADREDETRREAGIGRGGEPVVVADPVDDPGGQHVAFPAEWRPAPFALAPVVDQLGREDGCRGVAAVAQVA